MLDIGFGTSIGGVGMTDVMMLGVFTAAWIVLLGIGLGFKEKWIAVLSAIIMMFTGAYAMLMAGGIWEPIWAYGFLLIVMTGLLFLWLPNATRFGKEEETEELTRFSEDDKESVRVIRPRSKARRVPTNAWENYEQSMGDMEKEHRKAKGK